MAKRTNNKGVIDAFFNGQSDIESHNGNLWVDYSGKRLMNYGTCLVERNEELNKLVVNRTSYSVTTSKIQGSIGYAIWQNFSSDYIDECVLYVDGVHQGTAYLHQAALKKLEWLKGMKDVKLINYFDVWGNKKDGWEINNLCTEAEFKLHQNADNKEIVQKLKDVGFLQPRTRMTQLEIEDLHDFGVEIYQKKDMRPICRVEFTGGRY